MTRILVLIPLIGLLTDCQSKKEICAQYAAHMFNHMEAASRLGIDLSEMKNPGSHYGRQRVQNYCAYYKN